jgi:hypothetical protein
MFHQSHPAASNEQLQLLGGFPPALANSGTPSVALFNATMCAHRDINTEYQESLTGIDAVSLSSTFSPLQWSISQMEGNETEHLQQHPSLQGEAKTMIFWLESGRVIDADDEQLSK